MHHAAVSYPLIASGSLTIMPRTVSSARTAQSRSRSVKQTSDGYSPKFLVRNHRTILLDPDVWRELRRQAVAEHCRQADVLELALVRYLELDEPAYVRWWEETYRRPREPKPSVASAKPGPSLRGRVARQRMVSVRDDIWVELRAFAGHADRSFSAVCEEAICRHLGIRC